MCTRIEVDSACWDRAPVGGEDTLAAGRRLSLGGHIEVCRATVCAAEDEIDAFALPTGIRCGRVVARGEPTPTAAGTRAVVKRGRGIVAGLRGVSAAAIATRAVVEVVHRLEVCGKRVSAPRQWVGTESIVN